jgi:predicted GNAT family acetyltransferase
MPDPEVVDEKSLHRFALHLEGSAAVLQYRENGDRLILVHTEVPEELEGRGLGGALVRAALDRARAEELTIVPWCEFARSWLEKHEDEAATVEIDWDSQPT